ncbi:tetratricopeptide repeat protein [Pontibacter sp. 13R65]|uniref:tetratricopeptide repeat protein n=1 Tax=Pontibacter sp. 13R65 TaxID=3127458 RepID=UPI00301B89C9
MTNKWKYILLMATVLPTAGAIAQNVDQGRMAVDLEKYQQAKSYYKSQLNSKEADKAYFALGDVYLRTDKTDSAAYYFNQGLAKNSKSAINMVGLGKLELEKGNKAAAESHFEKAVKQSKSKDAYVLTMIGEAYVESNEIDMTKAIEYLNQAIQRDNKNPLTFVILGDAYLKQNDGGKALTNYDQAILINDKYPKAHLRVGQVYTRSRNYEAAEEAFNKAIAADPNYAPAYHDLGEMYYFAGKFDQAVSTFKKYVDMAEKTNETRAKYASFLFLTKDYQKTLAEVQEVLKSEPNHTVMNRLQAYSMFELGQHEQALKAMEDFLAKVDKNKVRAGDYEYYSKMLAKNNQRAKAIENLEKALAMEPNKPELYTDLANLYANNEEYDKAVAVYDRKAEKIDVSNIDYYYIGNIYMMAGQFQKADETYAKITETNPTYAYAHLWRARAKASLDPETTEGTAKPHYDEFIKLAQADPEKFKKELVESNVYLGYYYYLKADRENAAKHYQAAKDLDPTNAQAEAALAELSKTSKK